MEVRRKSLHLARISADYVVLIASFWIAVGLSMSFQKTFFTGRWEFAVLSLCVVWFFSTSVTRFYDEFRSRDFGFEIVALLKNSLIQLLSLILILFFSGGQSISRFFVVAYTIIVVLSLTFERLLFRQFLEYLRKRGRNLRNLLIVGAGKVGRRFHQLVIDNPQFGYNPIGFVDDIHKPDLNGQYLGDISNLSTLIEKLQVRDVIVALPNAAGKRVQEVIDICEKHTTRVRIIPNYLKQGASRYAVSMFGRFPIISVRENRVDESYWRVTKRIFDFVFSLFLFVTIFWWLWPLIAAAIKLTSPGKVFFVQERWGRDNKLFHAYKFRSMVAGGSDVDKDGKYQQAKKDDPRVTKVGRFLRATNLDELPQFWNVLKGEMSIVGPRPHPTPLNIESKSSIPLYMQRHLVKPGITGWAQINGHRGETLTPAQMQKRVEYDMWYIENWSFALDLRIIGLTIIQMFRGDPKAY
jgi:putative colanic acid biosynthesis UDP-glucose lipid carrier transferase